jgi:hypothetical protein
MKQIPIRLGPLALVLTVISICLTTLAILALSTARADLRLAERYAQTVTQSYALEVAGQTYLQEISEELQAGASLPSDTEEDGILRHTIQQGDASLHIALRLQENGYQIIQWQMERTWEQDSTLGDLWDGT